MVMETDEQPPVSLKRPRLLRRRACRWFLLYAVVPYAVVVVVFAVCQRRLMYQPTVTDRLRVADVDADGAFGKDAEIQTADGNKLRGWLLSGDRRGGTQVGKVPLVLYFPGNSLNRFERLDDLREIASRGFDVLIFDYRGFGDSTGSPTETDLTTDALLVWSFARNELGYEERRIVVFGESLGGAVALSLWSSDHRDPPQPAAVILNSTFASMPQTVAWHYPLFPFQFLLLDRWPSIERITRVQAPVIVFHGADDAIVPVNQGRALAQAAPNARFVEVSGATHNEIPMMRLRQELDAIMAALPPARSLQPPQ